MLAAIPNVVNLGNITLHNSHTFVVRIQNVGKEIITPAVKVGCTGCTQASLRDPHIQPGQETILTIIFTPKAYGNQIKTVRLNYTPKGLNQQSLVITFNATVI